MSIIYNIFYIIFGIIIYGGLFIILFLPLISYILAYVSYGEDGCKKLTEEAVQRKLEKIKAFSGTQSQSTYDNPSNITDDAFLLFIGEQKLAFGHPESAKSFGEEW